MPKLIGRSLKSWSDWLDKYKTSIGKTECNTKAERPVCMISVVLASARLHSVGLPLHTDKETPPNFPLFDTFQSTYLWQIYGSALWDLAIDGKMTVPHQQLVINIWQIVVALSLLYWFDLSLYPNSGSLFNMSWIFPPPPLITNCFLTLFHDSFMSLLQSAIVNLAPPPSLQLMIWFLLSYNDENSWVFATTFS